MQDEHETGKNGVGVARPGASAHEECREPQPGTDPRVFQVERTDRVCRVWAAVAGAAPPERACPLRNLLLVEGFEKQIPRLRSG
jgi:hypothetical protein